MPGPWKYGSDDDRVAARAELRRTQAGFCAACFARPARLYLDHDHATGLVRGLLCQSCNASDGRGSPRLARPWDLYVAEPPAAQDDVLARLITHCEEALCCVEAEPARVWRAGLRVIVERAMTAKREEFADWRFRQLAERENRYESAEFSEWHRHLSALEERVTRRVAAAVEVDIDVLRRLDVTEQDVTRFVGQFADGVFAKLRAAFFEEREEEMLAEMEARLQPHRWVQGPPEEVDWDTPRYPVFPCDVPGCGITRRTHPGFPPCGEDQALLTGRLAALREAQGAAAA